MTKRKPTKEWEQYQFRVRRVVEVLVTVEAKDFTKARELAESGDWIDEQEVASLDWQVIECACLPESG